MIERPRAAIFDLDGTLIDSRTAIFCQAEIMTKEFTGRMASREEIARAMHGPLDSVIRTLLGPDVNMAQARARQAQLHRKTLDELDLYDGCQALLSWLRKNEIVCAAVTSADHRIHRQLSRLGIDGYFDMVVTAEDVNAPKPDPQGVNSVLETFGVLPSGAVMIGDTKVDIEVGHRVGMQTIGVTHGFGTQAELEVANSHHVVDGLPQVGTILDELFSSQPQNVSVPALGWV